VFVAVRHLVAVRWTTFAVLPGRTAKRFRKIKKEELGVLGDEGGDVGAGEAEIGEEGAYGVGVGGGLEVVELRVGPGGVSRGEAASVDEVVVVHDADARAWGVEGRGGGEEVAM
jgi:hypothetical protein